MPDFNELGIDDKLHRIAVLKGRMRQDGMDPKRDEALFRSLDEREKAIRDSDRWYYKMFRSIAWGPTILINAILALFW